MNYQIMIVDHSYHKTFLVNHSEKNTISDSAINQVLKGKAYHGIKNKTFRTIYKLFDNDNTVGIPNQNNQKLSAYLCVLI